MKILPDKKPVFDRANVEKTFEYFLGENWKAENKCVLLGIRNPKIAVYNDEAILWTSNNDEVHAYNYNADPSAYVMHGELKAILKKGVYPYKLSLHKINTPKRRRAALRPATVGEKLPVWRKQKDGSYRSDTGVAINIHDGGADSTWSEGCQTFHFNQYWDFITRVGRVFNFVVPQGYGITNAKLQAGIGRIMYILIDQDDYNYIKQLPREEFDSRLDLLYQAKHFASVPKIEKAKPVETKVFNASNALAQIEAEAENNVIIAPVSETSEDSKPQAEEDKPQPQEAEGCFEQPPTDLPPTAETNDDDAPFVQYIPDIDNLKKWFYKQIGGSFIGNIASWVAGLPDWLKITLLVLLVLQVLALIAIVIYHRKRLFDLNTTAMDYKADRSKNSPVLTTTLPAIVAQVPTKMKILERIRRVLNR